MSTLFPFFSSPRSFCILLLSSLGLYTLCRFSVTLLRIDFAPRSLALSNFKAQAHSQPSIHSYKEDILKQYTYTKTLRTSKATKVDYIECIGSEQTTCSPSFPSASLRPWPLQHRLLHQDMGDMEGMELTVTSTPIHPNLTIIRPQS